MTENTDVKDWERELVECDEDEISSFLYAEEEASLAESVEREREAWANAKGWIDRIPVPPNYTTRVRAVGLAREKYPEDREMLKSISTRVVYPYLVELSDSLRATFFYAANELHPDDAPTDESAPLHQYYTTLSPEEAVSVLILRYLFGNLAKGRDEEDWAFISEQTRIHMEVGSLVGNLVPELGTGLGLLLSGMRSLSLAVLSKADKAKFTGYRRNLEQKNQLFDIDREQEIFGAHHLHAAALLLQRCGFPRDYGLRFASDICDHGAGDPLSTPWKDARILTEELHSGKFERFDTIIQKYADIEEGDRLKQLVREIEAEGSSFTFVTRGKADIPEHLTRASEKSA